MRLDQFDAIAERIPGENPLDAATGLRIEGDFVASPGERFTDGVQVMHEKRRVGFFCGTKIRLDAQVNLERAALEP